jgi:hypothetical protein
LEKVLAHKADIEQKILKDTTTANNKINDELHQIDTDINNLKTRLAAAPTAGGRLSLNTELAAKYNYRTTAAQKVLAAADKLVQTAHKQEVEEAKK